MGWFGKKKDEDGNEVKLTPREAAEAKLKNAVGAIYAVAILNAIWGAVLPIFFPIETWPEPGTGILRLILEMVLELGTGFLGPISSMIYGGLGLWVQEKRSIIGLGLAFGLYIAETTPHVAQTIVDIAESIASVGNYATDMSTYVIDSARFVAIPTAGIVIQVTLVYLMFQGFGGIQQLKSPKGGDQ